MSSIAPARSFPQVYVDLGIDLGRLGCLMLDTEPIKVSDLIPQSSLYFADPEKHKYIQGVVSETVPHVTLLYGFLRSAKELQKHIDAVLDGWKPEDLTIRNIDFFPSNEADEYYVTIIAHVEVTDNLKEANTRLSYLPHLNTFPDYKPHITLAYVRQDINYGKYIKLLNEKYAGTTVKAKSLNYGG